jgi:PAS domain S-box-containing protein
MNATASSIRILIIDDDADFTKKARFKLQTETFPVAIDCVSKLKDAVLCLQERVFDLVMLNPFFGTTQAEAAFFVVRKQAPNLPVLLVIDAQKEAEAVKLLDIGADDYLIKQQTKPNLLWHTARAIIQRCLMKERLQLLEAVATQSNDAVLIGKVRESSMLESKVVYQNPSFSRLSGLKQNELNDLASYLDVAVGKSSHEAEEILQAMQSGKTTTRKIHTRRKDGSKFWAELKVVTLRNVEKALQHVLLIHKDISQEELANSCKEQLSLLEKQQHFMACLAHDLKASVLSAESAYALLLQKRLGTLSEQQLELAEHMRASNLALVRLSSNLLQLYETQLPKPMPLKLSVDLKSLVEQCVDDCLVLAKANKVTISLNISKKLCNQHFDADVFKKILGNLIDHALAFSPPGGTVFVIAKEIADEIVIRVIDEGPALSKEDQANIFKQIWNKRASRRYTASTSLALYTAKQMVENYGGTISCISGKQSKTTIEVTLPKNYLPFKSDQSACSS